jgi:transcriptional regulator with XRE-family HTH domain
MPRSKANTGRKGQAMPPEMADYADRLRRAFADRKERHGLTQKEIAARTGLSQSTISEAMNPKSGEPKDGITAAVITHLCLAMDVSTDFVLMGFGDEIPRLARRQAASPIPGGVELREASAPIAPPPAPAPPPPEPPAKTEQTAPRQRARKSGSP